MPDAKNVPSDCAQYKNYLTRLSYLILDKMEINPWQENYKLCQKNIRRDFISLIKIDQGRSRKELFKIFREVRFNRIERKSLVDHFTKKVKKLNLEKDTNSLKLAFKGLSREKMSHDDRYRIFYPIGELAKENGTGFLSLLLELVSSVGIENINWSKNIIKDLIKFPSEKLIFTNGKIGIEENQILLGIIEGQLELLLKKINTIISDKLLIKMLVNRLSTILPSVKTKELLGEYDASWSLSQIREDIFSSSRVKEFPGFWFMELKDRTSDTEVQEFLTKSFDLNSLKKLKEDQYWIFKYFFPKELEKRKFILDSLYKRFLKGDSYGQFLILSLLDNQVIKKGLAKRDPYFKKAVFQLERLFYRKLLIKGEHTEFSLYKLLQLGDKDPLNLWRFKIYGL